MSNDALIGFKHTAAEHGWRFGWHPSYPDIVTIACACGHLSVRDRDEVPEHVCPACGRESQRGPR